MILIIDNYDSFTFNLYQLLGEITQDIKVLRNDKTTVGEIAAMAPTHLILSPGPGNPGQAGICLEVIRSLSGKIPILGVCLGHQAIAEAFGGQVVHAPRIVHGKACAINLLVPGRVLANLPKRFEAARYHSLIVDAGALPPCLEITAATDSGEVMALQHREHHTYGVQFHPESIMTPDGRIILRNFLRIHN